jgi:hypothetical protein
MTAVLHEDPNKRPTPDVIIQSLESQIQEFQITNMGNIAI